MNSTFGAPSLARIGAGQAGCDTSKVRPITPLNACPGGYSARRVDACSPFDLFFARFPPLAFFLALIAALLVVHSGERGRTSHATRNWIRDEWDQRPPNGDAVSACRFRSRSEPRK